MKMMSRSHYWTLFLYLQVAGTPMRVLLYSPLVALFDSMSTRKQGQWTWQNETVKELNKLQQCLCGLEALFVLWIMQRIDGQLFLSKNRSSSLCWPIKILLIVRICKNGKSFVGRQLFLAIDYDHNQ